MPAAPRVALPSESPIEEELETVLTSFDTNYAWNYGCIKEGLRDLYEKSKREQWNGAALDWTIQVDPETEIIPAEFNPLGDYEPYRQLSDKQKREFNHAQISWQLSQFMHGEQGAMIVASQLVGAVPWMDAKYYAGTQTMDEARHVEVFSRYLHEKLEWEWPITDTLKELLDATITDSRWDFKYLGMQVMIEGLAMAAFGNLYQMTTEPLLKELLRYVMRDESRHVAFGVLSLKGYYKDMSASELADREDFIIYASELMRDRLVGNQISRAFGWNEDEVRKLVLESEVGRAFRGMLFARIVPNLKRLGLLTPKVREVYTRLDLIKFEDFDAEAADRELGFSEDA